METIPAKGNYIRGRFESLTSPEGYLRSVSPADLADRIGNFPYTSEVVDRVTQVASLAFSEWKLLPFSKRMPYFETLAGVLARHADSLAHLISRETGKPLWESAAEVKAMSEKIAITREDGLALIRTMPSEDSPLRYSYKPRGVLTVLGPFNMPGHLPWGHIIPALMTGNTVIFKPSELSPAVGQKLAEIIDEVGIPPGVFNLIQGEEKVGSSLIQHADLQGILFTGSYQTGQKIQKTLQDHFGKILALEMGGKNAAIVLDDAPLDKAVYEVCIGAFITTGQRCSSTSRLILAKKIADEFLSKLLSLTKKLKIGYPFHKDVFMGPLISKNSLERFFAFQKQAEEDGAEPLLKADLLAIDHQGFYVTPSVHLVEALNPRSIYQREEIFGPDLAVYIVDNLIQAVEIQKQSDYDLALSLFSESKEAFEKVFQECQVGVIHWNKATTGASSKLPFGGLKKSGNGYPGGLFAPYYCTYPVAIKVDHSPLNRATLPPGV